MAGPAGGTPRDLRNPATGATVRIQSPLDFLVVSDHAEALGLAPYIAEANPDLLATENGKRWYDMVQAGGKSAVDAAAEIIELLPEDTDAAADLIALITPPDALNWRLYADLTTWNSLIAACGVLTASTTMTIWPTICASTLAPVVASSGVISPT